MTIHRTDGTTEERYVDEIASITFSKEGEVEPSETEAVDMGLSVKWANRNLDAAKPEGFGGYYAWGETEAKDVYNETTYAYYNLEWGTITRIGAEIAGTRHDVAKKQLGGDWRMPTAAEWQELCLNCEWTWTTLNGVTGYKVTAENGNSIFLPAAGRLYSVEGKETNGYEGVGGFYWSGTLGEDTEYNYRAHRLNFGDTWHSCDYYDVPEIGMSVRAVQGAIADTDDEPEPGPKDMVDLGLSVKWASHNVMASTASDPGYYYAWGVCKKQAMYGDGAYKWKNEDDTFEDLGRDISGTQYDVANVRWGEGWRLPTKEEIEELLANTTQTWTTLDGQLGFTLTAANGNSIFLPVKGYYGAEGLVCADLYDIMGLPLTSFYMTANPKPLRSGDVSGEHSAYALRLSKSQSTDASIRSDDTFKSLGIFVRPVHE